MALPLAFFIAGEKVADRDTMLNGSFLNRLPLQIGPYVIEARIAFCETFGLHFNLLGRLDVFSRFNISFREQEGLLVFEPVESLSSS